MTSERKRKRGLAELDSPRNAKAIKTPQSSSKDLNAARRASDASSEPPKKQAQVTTINESEESANGVLPSESPKTQIVKNGPTEPKDVPQIEDELRRKEKKAKRHARKEWLATVRPQWKLSEPTGGRMMNIDPVFAGTEYLILAHRLSLQVYSTSTSLLVRSIPLAVNKANQTNTRIVAYCISPKDPAFCWAACSNGAVFRVEWATGAGAVEFWNTSSTGVIQMTAACMESMGRKRDVLFTTEARKEGGYRISAHELNRPTSAVRTIFTISQPIHTMKTLANGEIIVAAAENKVLIGTLRSPNFGTVDSIKYEFRTFELSSHIGSLDARIGDKILKTTNENAAPPKKSSSTSNVLNVVVGDVRGVIFVYNDLLGDLIRLSRQGGKSAGISITPRKLHWHRKAVRSVKWSLDGNYLISGGSETVLVLWQLDTGHTQFLPHLTAAIQNIVLSPRGNSYAIHIADNSTMVLSTSELAATANLAGIQAPVIEMTKNLDSYISRIDNQTSSSISLNRTPAVINPANPSHLLLAVGEMQEIGPESSAVESSPFLQTFDISKSQNIARQALARTNITNKNIGPEGPRLIEPKTTHMQISFDGSWLATVDEWQPPTRDLERLTEDSTSTELFGREVYLKFWQWHSEDQAWELVSRVDAPHTSKNGFAAVGRVLDLAADPSSLKFSTIGEDGVVRVWCPKTRKRDNVIVRGNDGNPLRSWSCRHVIALRVDEIDAESIFEDSIKYSTEPTASLAYSEDGSVLGAAVSGAETGFVHLINAETGSVHESHAGHFGGDIVKMAILDQYLITLSDELRVYDLVNERLSYGVVVSRTMRSLSTKPKLAMVHFAADKVHHTFAVAIPRMKYSAENDKQAVNSYWAGSTDVTIFEPTNPNPLYTTSFPSMITTLLPASSSPGYIVLDTFAEIRNLAPKVTQTVIPRQSHASEAQIDEAVTEEVPAADIMELAQEDAIEAERIIPAAEEEDDDDDYPVVTQQQLTNLFDIGPAFALPPIEEMFYQVADLFGSKPSPQAVA